MPLALVTQRAADCTAEGENENYAERAAVKETMEATETTEKNGFAKSPSTGFRFAGRPLQTGSSRRSLPPFLLVRTSDGDEAVAGAGAAQAPERALLRRELA